MSEQYQVFEIHILKKTDNVYPLIARASGDATFHSAIPIEMLVSLDAEHFEGFLARSAATPIVRHLSSSNPARPPIRGKALCVLMILAEPIVVTATLR